MAIINHTVVFIAEPLSYIIALSIINARKGSENTVFKPSSCIGLMMGCLKVDVVSWQESFDGVSIFPPHYAKSGEITQETDWKGSLRTEGIYAMNSCH